MKSIYLTLICFFILFTLHAQIGIGTLTPDASSAMDVNSNNKGILIPRITQTQRLAIATPAKGLLVFQTNGSSGFYYYNGTNWTTFGGGDAWGVTGNAGTNASSNFLGTTDNQPLSIRTNSTEAIKISANGNVGIGTTAPEALLHVEANSTSVFDDGFEDNTLAPFIPDAFTELWTVSNTTPNTGTYAAQSARGTDLSDFFGGSTLILEDIVITQTSVISFSRRVPAVFGYNYFFQLNNGSIILEEIIGGGTGNYEEKKFILAPGTYTFRWDYIRLPGNPDNNESVLLDDVKIQTIESALRIEDGNEAASQVLISDANGNASWGQPTGVTLDNDDDWRFFSGTTNADPIYRTRQVNIGVDPATTNQGFIRQLLDVWNDGAESGTSIGLGSNEFVTDGLSEFQFSHSFAPLNDNSYALGISTNLWNEIFSANGMINTSDRRDKTNIKPLVYGRDALSLLNTYRFQWKNEFTLPGNKKRKKIGFIAQQLGKVLPETLVRDEWYVKGPSHKLKKRNTPVIGVRYAEVLPVVVSSIKEDQEQLDLIKLQHEKIETLINILEKE